MSIQLLGKERVAFENWKSGTTKSPSPPKQAVTDSSRRLQIAVRENGCLTRHILKSQNIRDEIFAKRWH
jgi:hypothetical protein